MKTDMKKGESILFLDYEIYNCENDDGIVLRKQKNLPQKGYECHLGNYSTKESAMQAAVIYFMLARPEHFATTMLYRATGSGGQMYEWFVFQRVLKCENIEMPKEITHTVDGNFQVTVNHKPIRWRD